MPAELPRVSQFFPCDFEGCTATFRNPDDLARHKVSGNSEHEYCTVCSKGFKDWATFVQHKIRSPLHISCPVCAADFNSDSGKDRHIQLSHQKAQHLVCLGCNQIFTRAAALIGHMEEGRCTDISQEAFKTTLYRKEVLNDILKDPNRGNEPAYASSQAGESEHGGVALMDQADPNGENKARGLASLKPILSTASANTTGTATSRTTSYGVRSFRTSSSGSIIGSYAYRANSSVEERLEEYEEDVQSLNSSLSHATLSEKTNSNTTKAKGKDEATDPFPALFTSTSAKATTAAQNTAWANTSTTASTLFPHASKTPLPQQPTTTNPAAFAAGLQQINNNFAQTYGHPQASVADRVTVAQAPINLVTIGPKLWDLSWDPDYERYTPEKFFNQTIQMYECPHKHCSLTTPSPKTLTSHLHSSLHSVRQRHCPSCLRTFKSVTALIAHCESASTRCRIRETDSYDRVLGQISGGFLAVEPEDEEEEGIGSIGKKGNLQGDGGVGDAEGRREKNSGIRGGGDGEKVKGKGMEREWEKGMVSYKAVRPAGFW